MFVLIDIIEFSKKNFHRLTNTHYPYTASIIVSLGRVYNIMLASGC